MGREPVVDGVSAFIRTNERYWTATIPAGSSNKIGSEPGPILSYVLPRHNSFPWTGLILRIFRRSPWENSRVLVLAVSFVYELHRYRALQAMELFLIVDPNQLRGFKNYNMTKITVGQTPVCCSAVDEGVVSTGIDAVLSTRASQNLTAV